VEVGKFDAPLGAEVIGVNLREPICEANVHQLREALYDNQVLLIRGQSPSIEDQLRFTAVFGNVDEPWDRHHKHPENSNVQIITNAGRKGITFKSSTLFWHTDQSFTSRPSRETLLRAVSVPSSGGETLFATMRAAYADLPGAIRSQLDHYHARHAFGYLMRDLMGRRVSKAAADMDGERFPPVVHPLVRTHPATGSRSLYLNELCVDRIIELEATDSEKLLQELLVHALHEKYIYRHKWCVGDLIVWDNASLMHRADEIPEETPRIFHRTNTVGQEPF
jgi:taurine dioxygenase